MKTVRAVIKVELVHDVELSDWAVQAMHRVLGPLEPGQNLCIEVGRAMWATERFLHFLREYVADAAHVQIVGTDVEFVNRLVAHLSEVTS